MKAWPVTLLGAAGSLLGLAALHAQTDRFKDDFDAGIHADWTRLNDGYFQDAVQYLAENGGFRLVVPPRTEEHYADGGFSYLASFRTNLVYGDFTVAVDATDVPVMASTGVGLLARMQGVQFTDGNVHVRRTGSGYLLVTYPSPWQGDAQVLALHRLDNLVTAPDFSYYAVFPRVLGRQHRLVFTGRGDHLVGQIFDLTDPSAPLITIEGHDGTYARGTVGLHALSLSGFLRLANEPVDVTFDNFAVATPEPLHEFTEDFEDGSDAQPGFQRYDRLGSLGAPPAEFTFADGAMSIAAPASVPPEQNGAFAGAILKAPLLTDVETSVDFWGWNKATEARPMFYLVARGQDLGNGTDNCYGLYFSPRAFPEATGDPIRSPTLSIAKVSGNVPETPALALAPLTGVNFNPLRRYRLRFSVQADMLHGSLFELANPPRPLMEVWAKDASYTQAGYTGFVAGDRGYLGMPRRNGSVRITVDNFRVRGRVEGPALAIEPAVVLSWPAASSGYVVEGAELAEGPWTTLGVVPTAVDGLNTVTMKMAGGMTLYRLRKPFINE